jgi:hypothetical protein
MAYLHLGGIYIGIYIDTYSSSMHTCMGVQQADSQKKEADILVTVYISSREASYILKIQHQATAPIFHINGQHPN